MPEDSGWGLGSSGPRLWVLLSPWDLLPAGRRRQNLWVCPMQGLLGDMVLRERMKGSLSGA